MNYNHTFLTDNYLYSKHTSHIKISHVLNTLHKRINTVKGAYHSQQQISALVN